MKKIILAIILVAGLAYGAKTLWFDRADNPVERSDTSVASQEPQLPDVEKVEFDKTLYSIDQTGSIWLIVNKDRPIGMDYVPAGLRDVGVPRFPGKPLSELQLATQAAKAVEELVAAAKADGVEMMIGSGYRSYSVQEFYYNNYVKTYGQAEADKFSAKPGSSEHQTGLAVDMAAIDQACYLEICFETTAAGKWLAENAHTHGFIIRYPKGKSGITGYQYEPWHLRFVGAALADELHDSGLTMEEFFEL